MGVGTLNGPPAPYLCHTLCELGAEPLNQEPEVIGAFLKQQPDQVVVVIVEDYVPPATIERAFQQTGLTRYVATLTSARRSWTLRRSSTAVAAEPPQVTR